MKRLREDQTGAVLVLATATLTGMLAVAALVTDMGIAFARGRELQALADGAARAGAMQLDLGQLRARDAVALDAPAAVRAARTYLAAQDFEGHQSVTASAQTVRVELEQVRPAVIAGLFGLERIRARARAVARPRAGIDAPEGAR